MASLIDPEVKKNSKAIVFEVLPDPRSEQVHKPTDEQYPTGMESMRRIQYQRSLKGILHNANPQK